MVKDFFLGNSLPTYITHTNLVLLLKKKDPQSLLDVRPITFE